MHMKRYILILKRILSEKFIDVEFDFYLSSRSKNVHMGLNCNILTLSEHVHIISDIENVWNENRQDNKFVFVMPYLFHTTRWKNDYIVFKKLSVEFKKCSSSAHVPKRAHNGSAIYDVWSAEKVILKLWSREYVLIDLKVAIPEGYYGRVVGCSSIAKKYDMMVHNGNN